MSHTQLHVSGKACSPPCGAQMFGMYGRQTRYFNESPCSSDGEEEDDDWAQEDADLPALALGEPSQPRPVQPANPQQPFLDLPPALLLPLLASLPADVRLLCREVCPGWRDMLRGRELWTRLDISNTSGVGAAPTEAFIRALSRASGHRMETLHARGCGALVQSTLIQLLRSNAATLRSVTLGVEKPSLVQTECMHMRMQRHGYNHATRDMLVSNLPRDLPALRIAVKFAGAALEVLEADIRAESGHAVRLLRNRFGPVRANQLNVQGFNRAHAVTRLAEAIADHASLRGLELTHAPLAPDDPDEAITEDDDVHVVAFGKLCDVLAAAPHVTSLQLWECSCCAASLEHLGRLLGAGTLRQLALCADYGIFDGDDEVVEESGPFASPTPAFEAGLRASALTHLTLTNTALFDTTHGAAVVRALAGHATLRKLNVSDNPIRAPESERKEAARAAVDALAAVLAADGLTELDCRGVKLAAMVSLEPLYAALAKTKRLRTLCASCNGLSSSDVEQSVAPAARSSCLLELRLGCGFCDLCEPMVGAATAIGAEIAARARARGYVPYGPWSEDEED